MIRDVSALGRLFSSSHINSLAWHGRSDLLDTAASEFKRQGRVGVDATLADVLDASFEALVSEYRIEYVFKSCVLLRMLFGVHSPRTTAFYSEFAAGESRADVVLVNGTATAYEIKTPFDDYSRLDSQLADYYRCFSRVVLFVDQDNAAEAAERVPPHTGVVGLSKRFSMSVLRSPSDHFDELDHRGMFRMLRRGEYSRIGTELGVPVGRLHPRDVYAECLEAFENLGIGEAHAAVVSSLKKRQRTSALAALCAELPRSLHLAAFSYRLRVSDWRAVAQLLSQQA